MAKEKKKLKRVLTMKELAIVFWAARSKQDENGELKDTKFNRWIYDVCCATAGGEQELEQKCYEIYNKLKAAGYDVD